MQVRLRQFIKTYNETHNATIILTSHYMADVVTLCKRVILIHHGKLLYDGGLDVLAERLAPYKIIHFSLSDHSSLQDDNLALPEHALILSQANGNFSIRVQRDQAPHITAHLLNTYKINDLSIENPAVESVIDRIYSEEAI